MNEELLAVVEAILFASEQPVEPARVAASLEVEPQAVEQAFAELKRRCDAPDRGVELVCKGGRYRFVTKRALGATVARFLATRRANLSNAAMETLAIAAYHQPVTKTYISQIRGVSSSEIVETLVEKGLLAENGKMTDLPGRPMSYGTTDKFLTVFGLDSLDDLPQGDFLTDELSDLAQAELAENGAAGGETGGETDAPQPGSE